MRKSVNALMEERLLFLNLPTDMRLLFILLIACLLSCSEGHKSSELLMINLDEISYEPMDISAVADSVIYIQFDNSFILPGFASLHWADSCFFANTREGVLKYDTRGRFLCKIGDIGDGPEEYPRYSYRCIMDKSNEVIYIYVYSEQKLLRNMQAYMGFLMRL